MTIQQIHFAAVANSVSLNCDLYPIMLGVRLSGSSLTGCANWMPRSLALGFDSDIILNFFERSLRTGPYI